MKAPSDTKQILIRLIHDGAQPGTGVAEQVQFGLQDSKGGVYPATAKRGKALNFELTANIKGDVGKGCPVFSGPFCHGSPKTRFIYLSWKHEGKHAAPWAWRIKVPLSGISWSMIRSAGNCVRLFLAFTIALFLVSASAFAVIAYPYPLWTPKIQKEAEDGDREMQMWLGLDYKVGWGVKQDLPEALKWLHKSADQDYAPAKREIGQLYETGVGVKQDFTEALKWFRMAADRGDADAQSLIGWMYERGEGVQQDLSEAEKWYRKAGEQGDAGAKAYLGYRYATGTGVKKDDTEAMKWFRLAADQGDTQVLLNIAYAYENGQGITQDSTEAYFWLSLYSKKTSTRVEDKYSTKLTQEQKIAVDKRVADWIKAHPAPAAAAPPAGK